MKTRIFSLILIVLIVLFPFRYAYITSSGSNALDLASMVVTIFGAMLLVAIAPDNKVSEQ